MYLPAQIVTSGMSTRVNTQHVTIPCMYVNIVTKQFVLRCYVLELQGELLWSRLQQLTQCWLNYSFLYSYAMLSKQLTTKSYQNSIT